MRNSPYGLIEPAVRSSSPYFESLKWKPPSFPAPSRRATTSSMLVLGRWWPRSTRHCARSPSACARSEEHTSELQSLTNLVCRLLLEKKKTQYTHITHDKRRKPSN